MKQEAPTSLSGSSSHTNEMWQHFYLPHRKYLDTYCNNDCVYTSKVKVFKIK